MRDDFPPHLKELLAKRVGYRCSNPGCGQPTSGPQIDPQKALNVGVAAHITAAAPGGPRYSASFTPDQRASLKNGIWLCQTCAKLVDNDEQRYTAETLRGWRQEAEFRALRELEAGGTQADHLSYSERGVFSKVEALMRDLLDEMRKDLAAHPLSREFVVLKKGCVYSASQPVLAYYYEDHAELDGKLRILANHHLIEEITYNNVDRYVIMEEFAEYLTKS